MGIDKAINSDDRNTKIINFKTLEEARKAYNEGTIGLGTRIKIG